MGGGHRPVRGPPLPSPPPHDSLPLCPDATQLFGRFGSLSRCVLPPSRSMALAEFSNAGEAKTAFRALAYKKFKHLPLYLEFAPEGLFHTAADPTRTAKAADSEGARRWQACWVRSEGVTTNPLPP